MLQRGIWVLIFICFVFEAFSQCTITAKREVCINDLVAFSLNTGGNTVTAYNWDFGSYGTSTNSGPLVKFTAKGTLIVSCTATLSGGQTCSDTHELKVYPSPKAYAVLTKNSLQCLHENEICLTDSIQKYLRGIKSVSLLWGDGDYIQYTAPIPKKWCHNFTDTGSFNIQFEVADSVGCKDKFGLSVRIFPSVTSRISSSETLVCDSTKICLKDSSVGIVNGTYQWFSMPGNKVIQKTNSWCFKIGPSTESQFKLVSTNEYGCKDSVLYQYKSLESDFYLSKLDSLLCINELVNGKLVFYAGEEVQWLLNGKADYIDQKYVAYSHARLGMNYVTVKRIGGCKGTLMDSFVVIGVKAVGRIYNENRRKVEDTVFLIDYTKAPPGTQLVRLWDFGDSKAPQCTTWTAKGQNVGINCNFSRDSIGRHFYSDSDCYAARLIITDLVSGCYDDTLIPVYRRNACPKVYMPRIVCLGDFAGFSLPGNMYDKVRDNNYLITDTVKPSDTLVLYGGYGKYKYKTLGYKSPVLWRYYPQDTVWTEQGEKMVVSFIRKGVGWVADTFINEVLVVERSNAEFDVIKLSECDPFSAKLTFKDSIWKHPGSLVINWGDTTVTYNDWKDSVVKLTPFVHKYKSGGFYTIEVNLTPTIGCAGTSIKSVAFSHIASVRFISKCYTDAVCFVDSVVDLNTNIRWNKSNNYGKLYWDFGDGKLDSGYQVCHQYSQHGNYQVTLTAVALSGCKTITKDSLYLTKPKAGIKHQGTIYCSDIRQFFDSSFVNTSGGQKIVQYNWNFGDGSQPVFVKNPAHIFPAGGVYTTRLIIKTSLGCTDTAYRNFQVIGPEVKATIISDSIGCAPLTVDFGNLSKTAKNFIWQFGDLKNTIYSTDRDTNTQFTYKDAGVYFVHIIGGDSFLNPTTGSRYYCSVRYPGPGQKPLRITVFESAAATFVAPETLCAGDSFWLKNTSTNGKLKYLWNLAGDTQTRVIDSFLWSFSESGIYTISLKPVLPIGVISPCVDTSAHTIRVVQMKPDFEYDCSKTKGSELVLENTSGFDIPGYEWTLIEGLDSSEIPLSYDFNLNHDFKNDTGYKLICLGINGGKSCGGKICKNIKIQGDIYFANVFTPGDLDGYNDVYKVPLYGYADFEIRIFNRWGERVFYSKNPHNHWNGLVDNQGETLPSGPYFYKVKYRPECADKPIEIHGSIELIR